MMSRNLVAAGALAVLTLGGAAAQQVPNPTAPAPTAPQPRTRTVVVPVTEPATITLSVRGPEAKTYLTVKANKSDVRKTLSDMADKAGVRLLLAPSASGVITGSVDSEPVDTALAKIAALANLSVRTIMLPEASAATLTTDDAGRYAEALSGLPVGAVVADPMGGKALAVTTAAPAADAGQKPVYYVQGTMSPEQERLARAVRDTQNRAASPASQDFVNRTAQSLAQMPLDQRFQAMRDLQHQMFQNMSPEDRDQLRQMFRNRGGQGGWGGRRGGRGQDQNGQ